VITLQTPLHFAIRPLALTVLVPPAIDQAKAGEQVA